MFPIGFRFSQSNLQDFVDCPRRFQLRYLERQMWPGVQVEPVLENEWNLDLGARFHRLVERHQLGVSVESLTDSLVDPVLRRWWSAYLGFEYLHTLGGRRFPEFTLTAVVNGYVLVATYDLVVVLPDSRLCIFDWKTYSRMPSSSWFLSSLQTRVYRYLLASVGLSVFGEFSPVDVSMIYWAPSFPDNFVALDYDLLAFREDGEFLELLVDRVLRADWFLTGEAEKCRFCEFRSFCGRGHEVGKYMDNNVGEFSVFDESFFGDFSF